MYCPNCGETVREGKVECPSCGLTIGPKYYQRPTYPRFSSRRRGSSSRFLLDRRFLIPIFLVLLVIAWVWLSLNPPQGPMPEESITVNVQRPGVMEREIDNTTYYDATIRVRKISPKDQRLLLDGISVIIQSARGSILLKETPLRTDDPELYHDGLDEIVVVEAWYINQQDDGSLDSGDQIKITGLSNTYQSSTLQIVYKGERVGSTTITI
jgi:hypothetical protein